MISEIGAVDRGRLRAKAYHRVDGGEALRDIAHLGGCGDVSCPARGSPERTGILKVDLFENFVVMKFSIGMADCLNGKIGTGCYGACL